MTSLQECRLKMYIAVQEFLSNNPEPTSQLPDFEDIFKPFTDGIIEIRKIRELQELNITGILLSKNEKKSIVASLGTDLASRLYAYANSKGDQVMIKEVHYTTSELLHCTESILPARIQVLINCATPILPELKKYGVDQSTIDELTKALADFEDTSPQTRLSITERKESTLRLAELFSSGDSLLRKMDIMMGILRMSNPEFYNRYKFNRHLVDTSVRSLALMGRATDSLSGKPVKGVKFDFKPAGPDGNGFSLTKVTTEKGVFQVKSIPSGDYKISVSKPGFKPQVLTVSVTNVERTDVVAEMEK